MLPEVILAVLITNFKFSATGAEIVWNVGGVSYPTIGRETDKPSLPIKIQALAAASS